MPEQANGTSIHSRSRSGGFADGKSGRKVPATSQTGDFGTRTVARKQVLARAKRMLAVALEEDVSSSSSTGKKAEVLNVRNPAPGNGAWWLF